jgi:hypothetical protein
MKAEKLFNFALTQEEIWRVATERQIQQLSQEKELAIWVQTLAFYRTVEEYIVEGGEIPEGSYQVADGVIEVCGEEEDYQIILISNLRISA